MKMTVRSDLCRGHGRCYDLAEDFLEDDDEGFVTVRGQTVDVPADHVEDVRNAAASCPEGAITIIEA
ncbi:ferredoxin [Nocardioides bizhenqiangii]|uniref:Ferredoxin n=1 Tax=Nocardioides bizhenqiangii TaxID=3095076 RepID=A0ABZ0ZVT0_9ACTN|nr:ferredoxin [Nocardioides sp. HM61]WQQ28462.1 ferredoxin [Nocardioides sp. HM61]